VTVKTENLQNDQLISTNNC